jgi:hypothetical protein
MHTKGINCPSPSATRQLHLWKNINNFFKNINTKLTIWWNSHHIKKLKSNSKQFRISPKHSNFTSEIKLWKESQVIIIRILDPKLLCMAKTLSPFTMKVNYSLVSFKYATHFMWMWSRLQFNKVLSNAQNLSLENDELSSLYKVYDVPLKDNSSIYDNWL